MAKHLQWEKRDLQAAHLNAVKLVLASMGGEVGLQKPGIMLRLNLKQKKTRDEPNLRASEHHPRSGPVAQIAKPAHGRSKISERFILAASAEFRDGTNLGARQAPEIDFHQRCADVSDELLKRKVTTHISLSPAHFRALVMKTLSSAGRARSMYYILLCTGD